MMKSAASKEKANAEIVHEVEDNSTVNCKESFFSINYLFYSFLRTVTVTVTLIILFSCRSVKVLFSLSLTVGRCEILAIWI